MPSLVEIGPVVLDRKMKNLQTDGQLISKKKSYIEPSVHYGIIDLFIFYTGLSSQEFLTHP